MNIDILTLSVYRLCRDVYYEQREAYISQRMSTGSEEHVEIKRNFYAKNPDKKIQFEEHLVNKFGGCWEFNEIIGFLFRYLVSETLGTT